MSVTVEVRHKVTVSDHAGDAVRVETLIEGDCLHSADDEEKCVLTIRASDVHLTVDDARELAAQLDRLAALPNVGV